MRVIWIFPVVLAGCGLLEEGLTPSSGKGEGVEQVLAKTEAGEQSEVAEVAAQTVHGSLGRTVASLGNAAEPGLWLKTPLVAAEGPGQVRYPATGLGVAVTLIPIDGPATGGSQLSLEAMQALGIALTDLAEIEVRAGA